MRFHLTFLLLFFSSAHLFSQLGDSVSKCKIVHTVDVDHPCNYFLGSATINITSDNFFPPISGTLSRNNNVVQQFSNIGLPINLTGLPSGVWSYSFTDRKGCSIEGSFVIQWLDASTTLTKATCSEAGSAIVTLTGGVPPYTDPFGNQSNSSFTYTLDAGIYNNWTFTDSNGLSIVSGFCSCL